MDTGRSWYDDYELNHGKPKFLLSRASRVASVAIVNMQRYSLTASETSLRPSNRSENKKDSGNPSAISGSHGQSGFIPSRGVRLRMLTVILLCFAIASSSRAQDSSVEYEPESLFGTTDQSRISQLGRYTEEKLNCFLQFDQSLADTWTAQFGLTVMSGGMKTSSPVVFNRLKEDREEEIAAEEKRLKVSTRMLLNGLDACMRGLMKKVKNGAALKCMGDLVISEIESDAFVSAVELFDDTLPLPFLTFLDIRDLGKLLYQNRSWDQLNNDERNVYRKAIDYLTKEHSGRDKVFVIDQSCEWRNLDALKKLEGNRVKQLAEFERQVIRTLCLQVAHATISGKDLRPGTWVLVYTKWASARLKNLAELHSIIEGLKTQTFTTEVLCTYATTLATYLAEPEIEIVRSKRATALRLATAELQESSSSKEARLCTKGETQQCVRFRELRKSYDEELRCMVSFGELLTNHFLNSIISQYTVTHPKITYPEIVCKKSASTDKLAVRYCRCVGSFCTIHDLGEIKSNTYKLTDGTIVVTKI